MTGAFVLIEITRTLTIWGKVIRICQKVTIMKVRSAQNDGSKASILTESVTSKYITPYRFKGLIPAA